MKINHISIALGVLMAFSTFVTSCKKDEEPIKPAVDPYSTVKADATLRFEGASNGIVKNELGNLSIYRDKGVLFNSSKQKFGWSTSDNKTFFFLEFAGDPSTIGPKAEATIYARLNGAEPTRISCAKVEIIKVADGKVWIMYQQSPEKTEGYIVQKL